MILLKDALAEMIGRRDLEQITEDQYKRSLKSFELFLCRQANESDLIPDQVNAWIKSIQSSGRSPTTCSNYKAGLLTIWNYLSELRKVQPYIGKEIRQPKLVRKPVIAWTQKEIKSLLLACDLLCGRLRNGIRGSDLMRAWVLLGFETGLRPVDLRLVAYEDFDFQEMVVRIVQHKTGNQHTSRFSQRTAEAVKAICSKGPIFSIGKTGIRKWEKKLFAMASGHFGFQPRKGSGLGTLRKSHATEVFKEMGIAAAAQSLGHVGSTTTATRHYIDSRVRFSGILPTLS
jgi:integrase